MSSTPPSQHNDTYYFYIKGLPKHYTWQDLKDLVRPVASHGLHTDVALLPGATGEGHVRVQRKKDVENLYRFLTENPIEGRDLEVHLWDISQPHGKPKLLHSHPQAAKRSGNQVEGTSCHDLNYDAWKDCLPCQDSIEPHFTPFTIPAGPFIPVNYPQGAGQYASAPYDPDSLMHSMGWPQEIPDSVNGHVDTHGNPLPMCFDSNYSSPMEFTDESNPPESRAVLVGGLNYKARVLEIRECFEMAGRIVHFELQKDHLTGKFRGRANVEYATISEANKAIEKFNGRTWMQRRLRVRFDQERTILAPARTVAEHERRLLGNPLIVNGSSGAPSEERR